MSETNLSLSAFFGIKAGMTRIFDNDGNHIPVTVVKLIPNYISQVKTKEKDGYTAYQVSFNAKREKLISEPQKGHLKKASIAEHLSEAAEIKADVVVPESLGKTLTLDSFKKDTIIDVIGTSKGKGTAGVMKRYGFQGGPASHGSHFHRRPGSIGCRATPARVFANKKMPGVMGNEIVTTQNLKIVDINVDQGYMLIKGSVPGAKNSFVKIALAKKNKA
jgi:large subunit ribosomal protein L3